MRKLLFLLALLPSILFAQDSWVNVQVQPDNYPGETSWEIYNSVDEVVASSPEYTNTNLQETIVLLDEGDYNFVIYDVFGDGICCEYGEGWFGLTNTCELDQYIYDFSGPTATVFFTLDPCTLPQEGCTDEVAENYDPEAYMDDGSCEYIIGCMNENASNYDSTATYQYYTGLVVPGSSCNLNAWTNNYFGISSDDYNANPTIFDIGNPIWVGGNWYYIDAVNFPGNCNAPAVLLYVVNSPELADGNPWTYTPDALLNDIEVGWTWYQDPCTFIYGCTSPEAVNYNPEAGVDNGTCLFITGCTDSTSMNYNPAATQDDGSCMGGGIECTPGSTNLTVQILLDQYAGETGWVIYNDNNGEVIDEVLSGDYAGYPVGSITSTEICVADNTPILFEINDTYGDGLGGAQFGGIDGSWIVYTDCDTLSSGEGDFGDLYSEEGIVLPCEINIIEGCTDSNYLEFNPLANSDDGSCLTLNVYGCTNENSFNYDPLATSMLQNEGCVNTLVLTDWANNGWAGSLIYITQGDQYWGPFTVEEDIFTTTISLTTDIPVKAFFYSFGQSQTTSEQCKFEIINPLGDIVLSGGINPYTNPILSYNQYGYMYSGNALCGNICTPKIYGCLDSEAVNYVPDANTTDNSCYYNPGCVDPAYIEYYTYLDENGVEADYNDGSCEVYAIFGCTDEAAFNFNELATVNATAVEDNTDPCIPTVYGCTDPLAFNYDSDANTLEPGACIPVENGWTDPTAFNYDPFANTDNGSCIDTVIGCTDQNAYNYNELANTPNDDACLYDAGCYGGPGNPYWLNDGCYAWVIDVDSYCCTDEWDASCQSMYNYCQEGWPAGINDISTLGIVIYPNPTRDVITIETHLDIQIQVYDMMGKLVIDEYKASRLDLSKLSNGIYNMIILHEGVRYSKKVVKQ